MADDQPEQPNQPAEDKVLVKRVDDMMAPDNRNLNPAPPQGPYRPKKIEPAGVPPLKGVYKPKEPGKLPIIIKLTDDQSPPAEAPSETVAETPAETPSDNLPAAQPLDDQKTDEAVDDITAKESDTVLVLEDARAARKARALTAEKPGWKARLKTIIKSKWTWVGVLIILIIVFALPFTRYPVLGLALKKPVTITVLDSKTGTPVSNAEVRLAGAATKTDAEGQARLKAALGKHDLQVTKQYYKTSNASYFVGFKAPARPASEKLVATGRLVPISVVNTISGQPLKGAEIKLKGTSAKTDSNGKTNVALPAAANRDMATLSLSGYNTVSVDVQVTNQAVKANDFQLTPSGQVYFLSNASGTIDVVKTNLDGSDRQTVLAGTGQEDPNTTLLLASRDWRYLVLEASRDPGPPALYLIDTSTGKSTEFENSDADIKPIGWYGHDFIYDLTKTSQSYWQPGREVLKSYDADNQQLNQLDQNQAEGSATSYAYQSFGNFYIVNGLVVYSTQWNTFTADGSAYNTTSLTDTIRAVQPNGQDKKDYQTLPVDATGYIQAQLYEPQGIYFAVYDDANGSTSYYDYQNQSVKAAAISSGTFDAAYPTYLVSPSGNQTFWSELLDGQDSLFTGDANAASKKQIVSSGSYSPYGWYTDNYVLVSKNSSQLYIMPATGLSAGRQPIKITDYYKPAQTFNDYGYGYGGL